MCVCVGGGAVCVFVCVCEGGGGVEYVSRKTSLLTGDGQGFVDGVSLKASRHTFNSRALIAKFDVRVRESVCHCVICVL